MLQSLPFALTCCRLVGKQLYGTLVRWLVQLIISVHKVLITRLAFNT